MTNFNSYVPPVGLLKRGAIVGYDSKTGRLKVRLSSSSAERGQQALAIEVQAPHGLFYNNGLFIGTKPYDGTPVVIGQGAGGEYHFVSFLSENNNYVPELEDGVLLLQSTNKSKITLDLNNNIQAGSNSNQIRINTDLNYFSSNFNNKYYFTQAARSISGLIKRDKSPNPSYSDSNKLDTNDYEPYLKLVGLDPKSAVTYDISGEFKNPPFVEQRELIYEFQYLSDIKDDLTESIRYSKNKNQTDLYSSYNLPNRRASKSDTLSLSLVSPNFLMETIKGTVVDIFGNILDLNRCVLPVGTGENTFQSEKATDKSKTFTQIKEIERKSLAYHFEINARKDLSGKSAADVVDSTENYSRNRSRFFVDIDKEGQFKINVPASSEKGNIPLLARYENYSTYGADDNKNPDKLIFGGGGDEFDIHLDSFAHPAITFYEKGFVPADDRGVIELKTAEGENAGPLDRLTGFHLKHGMAFHDILQTCFIHQNHQYLDYQIGEMKLGTGNKTVDLDLIPLLTDVVSSTITVSGDKANAGGRSGQITFDGSIEFNIGANTIDRQSLWLDTAGGIVSNIGRDINGRSVVAATGGDFYLQVGGFGIVGDTRFEVGGANPQNNNIKGAVLDLRVLGSGGFAHIIRIDDQGVTIMTPGQAKIHSGKEMIISSDASIDIQAPNVTIQERLVLRNFKSI